MRYALLSSAFLVSAAVSMLHAQGYAGSDANKPPVIVTVGQPRAWTLEQARHLLERNRMRDLSIGETDPGPLNPNDVTGLEEQSIRQLISGSVSFDPALGLKNSTAQSQFNTSSARFNQLQALQTKLLLRQATVAGTLQVAQTKLGALNGAATKDTAAIAAQQAVVDSLTAESSTISSEISTITSLTVSAPMLNVTSGAASEETTQTALGSDPNFDALMKALPPGPNASGIAAQIKLQNFYNLQNQMVMRQLTLMGTLAGPNERVVIIELPQSIYNTGKLHLWPDIGTFWGSYIAQSWWQIDGVITCKKPDSDWHYVKGEPFRCPDSSELSAVLSPTTTPKSTSSKAILDVLNVGPDLTQKKGSKYVSPLADYVPPTISVSDQVVKLSSGVNFNALMETKKSHYSYAVELIPSESSLNVVQAHASTHQTGFAGVFGWLSGLGARGRFERQKNELSQFTQQETYASAFGKGTHEFGWTFGPQPGTTSLNVGQRVTYAVVVVPKDTTVIRMSGIGCGYRRRHVPIDPFEHKIDATESCGASASYLVSVNPTDDGIWVENVHYQPVLAGQRATLEINGTFGSETGVLINGTPLQQVPSIATPSFSPVNTALPTNAGDTSVQGVFENVEGHHLLASFVLAPGFVGKPTVTLVTAGKEKTINNLPVWESSGPDLKSASDATVPPLFRTAPALVSVSPTYNPDGTVTMAILGQGLNGTAADSALVVNGHLLKLDGSATTDLPAPNQYKRQSQGMLTVTMNRADIFPHWTINYVHSQGEQTLNSTITRDDDGAPNQTGCTYKSDGADKPTYTLKIAGSFFSNGFPPKLKLKSGGDVTPSFTLKDTHNWIISVSGPKLAADDKFITSIGAVNSSDATPTMVCTPE